MISRPLKNLSKHTKNGDYSRMSVKVTSANRITYAPNIQSIEREYNFTFCLRSRDFRCVRVIYARTHARKWHTLFNVWSLVYQFPSHSLIFNDRSMFTFIFFKYLPLTENTHTAQSYTHFTAFIKTFYLDIKRHRITPTRLCWRKRIQDHRYSWWIQRIDSKCQKENPIKSRLCVFLHSFQTCHTSISCYIL